MNVSPLRYEDERLQRMEQAALWLQRLHTAADDEQVVEAWLDWCQRDPLNQQVFDELAGIWETSGQIALEPGAAQPAAEQQPAPPVTAATTMPPRRRALAAALAGALVVIASGAWWLSRPQGAQPLVAVFASPVGANAAHTLADGSVLELGGGTRVTVSIDARERRVELHEGELFVTVHHDTTRPFRVEAGGLEVVATGTAFNVLRTAGRITVSVAEGSVETLSGESPIPVRAARLRAGQQLMHPHGSGTYILSDIKPEHVAAWRSGMLNFDYQPLAEIFTTINRYAPRAITIDERLREQGLTVTGVRVDGIEKWVHDRLPQALLALGVSAEVVTRADGGALIQPLSGRAD